MRPVTAPAGPACRPSASTAAPVGRVAWLAASGRLPALLTDRRRPRSPRPPPRPRSRPARGVAVPDLRAVRDVGSRLRPRAASPASAPPAAVVRFAAVAAAALAAGGRGAGARLGERRPGVVRLGGGGAAQLLRVPRGAAGKRAGRWAGPRRSARSTRQPALSQSLTLAPTSELLVSVPDWTVPPAWECRYLGFGFLETVLSPPPKTVLEVEERCG